MIDLAIRCFGKNPSFFEHSQLQYSPPKGIV